MIADHRGLVISLQFAVPQQQQIPRKVWHYKKAAWPNLRNELKHWPWQQLHVGTVDHAVEYFTDVLLTCCKKYIPWESLVLTKQSHPWLTEQCKQAIAAKNVAEGSDNYPAAATQCAEALSAAYKEHIGGD